MVYVSTPRTRRAGAINLCDWAVFASTMWMTVTPRDTSTSAIMTPVTAPPEHFGAHDRRSESPRHHQELEEPERELISRDMIGIPAKGRVAPCGIRCVGGRPAATPEGGNRDVLDPRGVKRCLERRHVVLRLAAGAGKAAYIRDRLDAVRCEDSKELGQRASRMPHGPDGRPASGKVNRLPLAVRLARFEGLNYSRRQRVARPFRGHPSCEPKLHSGDFRLLSRQRRLPAPGRRDRRRGAGRAVHPKEGGPVVPPRMPSTTVSASAGSRRRISPVWASTTSRCSSSSASSRPTSARRRAGFRSFLLAGPLWIKEKLFTDRQLRDDLGYEGDILYAEHHESHAASAFFPSPFEEAAFLTMDGVGEWATTSFGVGRGNDIEILKEIHWPDSLGLLYSAFTYYTGFKVNSGEYKVMGLAPYGEPKYVDLIYRELIDLKEDGSFTLNQRYFNYLSGLTMTNGAFDRLFGGPPREPETKLTQREMDLARSVQVVCEEVMLRMARTAHRETGPRPAVSGGRRGAQLRRKRPPASRGPVQGNLDPARGRRRRRCARRGAARLAPARWPAPPGYAGEGQHEGRLSGAGATPSPKSRRTCARSARSTGGSNERSSCGTVARILADEKVVGWFNGRMEFGPRALGARSILGDPRSPRMQAQMNIKIKFREGFRPFAPSVLRERVNEYFELDADSPYMLLVAPVKKERQIPMDDAADSLWGIEKLNVVRSDIPAVTHIDYSARIQTVSRETNPDYYDLIHEFECLTGCAVAGEHVLQRPG